MESQSLKFPFDPETVSLSRPNPFHLYDWCYPYKCVFFSYPDISNHSRFKSTSPRKLGTLWLFGDSNAERLYVSLKDGPLCNEVFKICNLSKMWVYPWPSIQPVAWDDKDFEPQQILDHIREVLERPEMNENSAMILNLGLHYMESTSLANYRILLKGVIDLLNERNKGNGELRYKTRVIWKTTTSMNKEKDIESRLKSDWQRFLNPTVGKYLV